MRSNRRTARPVWIGMSGGVDSALAATLLVQSGRECTGVTMDLGRGETDHTSVAAAAAVCAHLGIPHRVVALDREFRDAVVDATASAYAAGLTPNPCVLCNSAIKFGVLLRLAAGEGAHLATGHYVRVTGTGSDARLARAADLQKDQSYFLHRLAPDVLGELVFPLGELTKREVRRRASNFGLTALHSSESQDACFVGPGGYAALVGESHPEACRRGPVVTVEGTVVGEHDGICRYTVGQRKGLGIASTEPLFVIRLDASSNTVVVGPHAALKTTTITTRESVWWADGRRNECHVKVRYNSPAVPAYVTPAGDALSIELLEPVYGAAPGQSAVCYQGDTVVGGGIIGGTS